MSKKKSIFERILFKILRIFAGSNFANPEYSIKKMVKCFFLQKILRINSHVPWPVHHTTKVKGVKNIEHGSRCPGLSPFCYIDGRNGIEFGNNVWIGPRVSIISMKHDLNDFQKYIAEDKIKIGDNCWIATGAIITAGVMLGNHVIVAAGSVVTKSFPDNVLIAGVPAKIIRELGTYREDDTRSN